MPSSILNAEPLPIGLAPPIVALLGVLALDWITSPSSNNFVVLLVPEFRYLT